MRWIKNLPADQLFLSAVTIGEIQAGIEITREQDSAKAAELEAWLVQVVASYGVLAIDAATFREWARLKHRKSDTLIEDAMIAATARVHGLTIATRNASDWPFSGWRLKIRECAVLGVAAHRPLPPRAAVSSRL